MVVRWLFYFTHLKNGNILDLGLKSALRWINTNVYGLQTCDFINKRLQHRCFPEKFVKFLRAPILKNICERVLLYIPRTSRIGEYQTTFMCGLNVGRTDSVMNNYFGIFWISFLALALIIFLTSSIIFFLVSRGSFTVKCENLKSWNPGLSFFSSDFLLSLFFILFLIISIGSSWFEINDLKTP